MGADNLVININEVRGRTISAIGKKDRSKMDMMEGVRGRCLLRRHVLQRLRWKFHC